MRVTTRMDETKIGFLEQTIDDTVKVEEKKEAEEIAECEDGKKYPLFDYSKAPKPFPVRMIPHGICTSSDSDSDSESEAVAEEVNSPKQMPKESEEDYDFTDLTYDEYLEKSNKKDPLIDYSKAPKPFPVRMIPHGIYTSSDSDSDSESEPVAEHSPKETKEDTSDIDFTDITYDEYLEKKNKSELKFQSIAVWEDDKAPFVPKEESSLLDFTTSSILVKHGMKRPAEASAGDKDSKRAREMASQTSDEENKGGRSTVFL